jgi:carbonic anhydrase
MDEINKLMMGYRGFYQKHFLDDDDGHLHKLADGQSPQVAIIACSDSRVDPSLVMDSKLGELFVIRNVANLIPPYQDDNNTYHGTSAALEFAVQSLQVKHIIIFGHSRCAGIRALLSDPHLDEENHSFIRSWMHIADEVRHEIASHHAHLEFEEKTHLCEHLAIEKSLQNLQTFPFVTQQMQAQQLSLHGWYFDLATGKLSHFDATTKQWQEQA